MMHLLNVGDSRLPLSPGAARLLTRCLLEDDTLRHETIIRKLSLDPPLVFWIVVRLDGDGEFRGREINLERVADSLTRERLLRWLNTRPTVDDDDGQPLSADRSAQARLAGLTAASIRKAASPEAIRASTERLHSLLSAVTGHWEIWCEGVPTAELRSMVDSLVTGMPRSDKDPSDVDDELSFELRCHWDDDGDSGAILAHVIGQQHRLNALTWKFDETLEYEKLAAMKQLAYGASHEINNPLANISSRAQTLLRDERDPARQRTLAAINRQAFRAHEMIADMMFFAHPPRLEKTTFQATDLMSDVADELGTWSNEQSTSLEVQDTEVPITGDRVQLNVAIQALVRNSLESLGHGGTIRMQSASDGESIRLTVTDTGPGIPDKVRRHLFDPFFSGREAGRGLGFGMSKVWRIVQEHGGHVLVHSSEESGTEVSLLLPMD